MSLNRHLCRSGWPEVSPKACLGLFGLLLSLVLRTSLLSLACALLCWLHLLNSAVLVKVWRWFGEQLENAPFSFLLLRMRQQISAGCFHCMLQRQTYGLSLWNGPSLSAKRGNTQTMEKKTRCFSCGGQTRRTVLCHLLQQTEENDRFKRRKSTCIRAAKQAIMSSAPSQVPLQAVHTDESPLYASPYSTDFGTTTTSPQTTGSAVAVSYNEPEVVCCGATYQNYSWRSFKSRNAILSVFAVNALLAVVGANVALSFCSVNAIGSAFSVNSLFSLFSLNSVLSIGCSGAFMKICV